MKHIKEFYNFKPINEGADWILLRSINKELDSYNLNFLEPGNELLGDTIEFDTEEWYDLYNNLNANDKEIVDDLATEKE